MNWRERREPRRNDLSIVPETHLRTLALLDVIVKGKMATGMVTVDAAAMASEMIDHNPGLADRRAAAVVDTLKTKHGIPATRLRLTFAAGKR